MPRKIWFLSLLTSDATWSASTKSYTWTGLTVPNFVCADARHTIILRSWQCSFTASTTAGEIGTSPHTNHYIAPLLDFLTNGIVSTMPVSFRNINHALYLPVTPREIGAGATECRYFFDVNTISEKQNITIFKDSATDDLHSAVLIFEIDIA